MATEIASAYISVHVDTSQIKAGMARVRQQVDMTAQKSHAILVKRIRAINGLLAPVVSIAKAYSGAFIAFATKALTALYKMPTASGRAWKKTFDVFRTRVNIEMARIGKIFLKTPVFGRTMFQWMDKIVSFLKNIDEKKIKAFTKAFETAFVIIAASTAFKMVASVVKGISGLRVVSAAGKAATAGKAVTATGKVVKGATEASELTSIKRWTVLDAVLTPLITSLVFLKSEIMTVFQKFKTFKVQTPPGGKRPAYGFTPYWTKQQRMPLVGILQTKTMLWLTTLFVAIKSFFLKAIKFVGKGAGVLLLIAILFSVIKENWTQLKKAMSMVGNFFKGIYDFFVNAFQKIYAYIPILGPLIKGLRDLVDLISPYFESIKSIFVAFFEGILRIGLVLGALVSAMGEAIYTVWEKLTQKIYEMAHPIETWKKQKKERQEMGTWNWLKQEMKKGTGIDVLERAYKEFDRYIQEGYAGTKLKTPEEIKNETTPEKPEPMDTALGFTGRYVGFSQAVETAQDIQKEYLNKMDQLISVSKETRDHTKIFSDEVKKRNQ